MLTDDWAADTVPHGPTTDPIDSRIVACLAQTVVRSRYSRSLRA